MIVRVIAVLATAVFLVGCEAQFQDIDSDTAEILEAATELEAQITNPDSITVFRNLNGFPNIARVCIDGDAFFVTSQSETRSPNMERVPDHPDCAR